MMSKIVINTHEAPAPVGPYSQAIRVNDTLYVSGQIPAVAKTGEVITNDIAEATDQVMRNIWAILNEAEMDFTNIVKCSIFLTNMDDFPIVNAVYAKYFDEAPLHGRQYRHKHYLRA
jgi:2-iminobutanoate/2-iminopropanoate deaminase